MQDVKQTYSEEILSGCIEYITLRWTTDLGMHCHVTPKL